MNSVQTNHATEPRTLKTSQEPTIVKPTILIVGQDAGLRFLLEKAMQKTNYQTVTAVNYHEILQMLNRVPIDLILLDVLTNRCEEFCLCQEIRQHSPIPIIILSGQTAPTMQSRAKQAGANAYLTKPIRLAELQLCVESLLADKCSLGT